MNAALAVAFTLGCVAVVQAGLNRRIAMEWGLAPTIFVNGAVVLLLSVAFLTMAARGALPGMLSTGAEVGQLRWWWLLPGVGGFLLITGLPWAVARVGALQVFVGVVVAQMLASILWDLWVEGIAIDARRVAGAALALAGVFLVAWRE